MVFELSPMVFRMVFNGFLGFARNIDFEGITKMILINDSKWVIFLFGEGVVYFPHMTLRGRTAKSFENTVSIFEIVQPNLKKTHLEIVHPPRK